LRTPFSSVLVRSKFADANGDTGSEKRYEVELQLGRSDESHIIGTIEYWDLERKPKTTFPQINL
jgi:hypothetical protein